MVLSERIFMVLTLNNTEEASKGREKELDLTEIYPKTKEPSF